jgi:DNA polymerase-3 subunit delta'
VAAVARVVRDERPPHALLLLGPRGCGKTTLAMDLAAGLLCAAADPAARPCRECVACRKVAAGNHPDLHILEPEGAGEQIRIGQVQQLIGELALTAMEGRYRVAVISAAHRLNADAQNALLKTLEEPGPATCLVLCADDQAALLPTVISRTVRLRLALLPVESLSRLIVEEGWADASQARALAIAAGGRPGMARTLAARPEASQARARIGRTLLALSSADRRERLAAAAGLISDGSVVDAALRGTVVPSTSRLEPAERRRALLAVIEAWRDLGRDLAVAARGGAEAIRDLDQLEELLVTGPGLDRAALLHFLDRLDGLTVAIEGYANPELVLDALLLAWPRLAGDQATPASASPSAGRPDAARGSRRVA